MKKNDGERRKKKSRKSGQKKSAGPHRGDEARGVSKDSADAPPAEHTVVTGDKYAGNRKTNAG